MNIYKIDTKISAKKCINHKLLLKKSNIERKKKKITEIQDRDITRRE